MFWFPERKSIWWFFGIWLWIPPLTIFLLSSNILVEGETFFLAEGMCSFMTGLENQLIFRRKQMRLNANLFPHAKLVRMFLHKFKSILICLKIFISHLTEELLLLLEIDAFIWLFEILDERDREFWEVNFSLGCLPAGYLRLWLFSFHYQISMRHV